jgi:hypothetical protein
MMASQSRSKNLSSLSKSPNPYLKDEWLTLAEFQAEVKKRLNVQYAVNTLYKFVQPSHGLPHRKASGRLQFPLKAGLDWVEKNKLKYQ